MAKQIRKIQDENTPEPVQEKVKPVEYIYTYVTSCYFSHEGSDYSLHQNNVYQLPDCDFVRSLAAQGRLAIKK